MTEYYCWLTEYVEDSAEVSLTPPLLCKQGIEHVQQCKTVQQIIPDNEGPLLYVLQLLSLLKKRIIDIL